MKRVSGSPFKYNRLQIYVYLECLNKKLEGSGGESQNDVSRVIILCYLETPGMSYNGWGIADFISQVDLCVS